MAFRATVSVERKDRGLKRIKRLFSSRGLPRDFVTVGVQGSQAAEGHGDGGLTNADIAGIHEFGLGAQAERAPIRGAIDAYEGSIKVQLRAGLKQIINGRSTPRFVLTRLGVGVVGAIQQRINQGIPPELSEATIRRKGSSKQLIDTGQLKGSYSFEVHGV